MRRKRSLLIGGMVLSVVVVILLSLMADSLEKRHALRLDFSFNRITTQSDASEKVLSTLPHPVHAYALFTPGREDQALLGLLNRMAAKSSQFSYSVDSLVKNPLLAKQIKANLDDTAIGTDSLLIVCEATGRSKALDITDYIHQGFDTASQAYRVEGFQYEKKIAEALVYVTTGKVPKVQLLTGHGELGTSDIAAMEALLKTHNYQLEWVNLMRDQVLDPASPLLILSPQKDLLASELTAIETFTAQGGSMLITSDYGDPDELPLFDALYRKYGIERIIGIVIADEEDKASYLNSPIYLVPYMGNTDLTTDLISAGQTMLLLTGSRAFSMVDTASNNPLVSPILTSGLAYIKDVKKPGATLLPEPGDKAGNFSLALHANLALPDGTRSQALMLGNSSMLTDSWLYENTYSREFLLSALKALSREEAISLDIQPKTAVRPQMVMPGLALPLTIIILLPVLVLATGAVVLLKRRRRKDAASP